MPRKKHIRIYLYSPAVTDLPDVTSTSDFIWGLLTNPDAFTDNHSIVHGENPSTGKKFELREVSTVGNVVKGCLALLRDDAPHERRGDGQESPLALSPGGRVMEKNYFLYFRSENLLLWQFNLIANHAANMATMLTTLTGMQRNVNLAHVVKDVFSLTDDIEIEYVDFAVAMPKGKMQSQQISQLNPNDWSFNPFDAMQKSGAKTMSAKLSNRGKGGLLKTAATKLIHGLTGSETVRKLKVKIDGCAEPIDMLMERYTYREEVEFHGHYPSPEKIFEALQAAKQKYDAEQTPTSQ